MNIAFAKKREKKMNRFLFTQQQQGQKYWKMRSKLRTLKIYANSLKRSRDN